MKAKDLIKILEEHPERDVCVSCGPTLHPIKEAYNDDAPFGNLHSFFIIGNTSEEIKRPSFIK